MTSIWKLYLIQRIRSVSRCINVMIFYLKHNAFRRHFIHKNTWINRVGLINQPLNEMILACSRSNCICRSVRIVVHKNVWDEVQADISVLLETQVQLGGVRGCGWNSNYVLCSLRARWLRWNMTINFSPCRYLITANKTIWIGARDGEKKKLMKRKLITSATLGYTTKWKYVVPIVLHTSNTKHIEVIQFIIECDNYFKKYTYIYVNTQESEQLEPVNAWMDSWVIKMFADSVFWLRD